MNAAGATTAPAPLLFRWEPPRQRRVAIAMFLFLSLLGHAFCFYLFQIVYPPTIALLPPPAHVSLISRTSEEGRTLLRWIDAEDPALAFATQRPPEARLRALPKTTHVPSYLRAPPALKQLPEPVVDLRTPSSQPPGPVGIARAPAPASVETPTTVSFSDEFRLLGAPTLPHPVFTASNNDLPRPTRFRVAIGARGDVRYCFALNSSGDPALDEQARRYLALCRFPARSTIDPRNDQVLFWGIATIDFGSDVTPVKPSSATPPAP